MRKALTIARTGFSLGSERLFLLGLLGSFIIHLGTTQSEMLRLVAHLTEPNTNSVRQK